VGEAKRRATAEIPAPQYVMDNPDFLQMSQACAGMPLDRALQAAFDMLAQCIGLATDDPDKAESVARQTGEDLARTIRENWSDLSNARRLMSEPAQGGKPS
jgi:hypothetical protein